MADPLRVVVLEGDETGQELLEQSLRVLDGEHVTAQGFGGGPLLDEGPGLLSRKWLWHGC